MQEISQEQIEKWQVVTRKKDGAREYAKAQFNLGQYYQRLNGDENTHNWKKYWLRIKREDNRKIYARVQFGLSIYYQKKKDDIDAAAKYWLKIERDDDAEFYAKAQFNLGVYYNKVKKLPKESAKFWNNIKSSDNSSIYATAQFNLGNNCLDEKNYSGAREHWLNIKLSYDVKMYASARFNLAMSYANKQEIKKAVSYLKDIKIKHDFGIYIQSVILLARYEGIFKKSIFEDLINWICNKEEILLTQYDKNVICDIKCCVKSLNGKNNKNSTNPDEIEVILYFLLFIVNRILEKLRIGNTNQEYTNDICLVDYENNFAHYTRPSTAHLLLEGKENSSFRLSTLENVNDPTEGEIIYQYLKLEPEKKTHDKHAFISCFSFNHDWLNQFRLYGKNNNQEASGVSLVMSSTFFDLNTENTDSPYIYHLSSRESSKTTTSLSQLPLYRCIYVDKDSNFFKIARREEWTFYRENYYTQDMQQEPEIRFEKYREAIAELESQLKKDFSILDELVEFILKIRDKDIRNAIEPIMHQILLKLRYLIKHMAFKEEQECRIYCIDNLQSDLVKYDFEKEWLYINYLAKNDWSEDFKNYVDYIYLAPEALKYKSYFVKVLGTDAERVRESGNPFRNPVRT